MPLILERDGREDDPRDADCPRSDQVGVAA